MIRQRAKAADRFQCAVFVGRSDRERTGDSRREERGGKAFLRGNARSRSSLGGLQGSCLVGESRVGRREPTAEISAPSQKYPLGLMLLPGAGGKGRSASGLGRRIGFRAGGLPSAGFSAPLGGGAFCCAAVSVFGVPNGRVGARFSPNKEGKEFPCFRSRALMISLTCLRLSTD
jgi:hypothetical protein